MPRFPINCITTAPFISSCNLIHFPAGRFPCYHVACLCYDPRSAETLARVKVRLLLDTDVRAPPAANAWRVARENFSLDKMGREYDAVLRPFAARPDNALAS